MFFVSKKLKTMKRMITTLLNRLFGSEICSQRAMNNNEMKVAGKVEVNVEKPEMNNYHNDPDLIILAANYGELVPGKEIMIELGEAAKMLGRTRVRLDAFSSLTKKLHNEYGVELKIYSRRTKLETKGAEDEDLHGRNSD